MNASSHVHIPLRLFLSVGLLPTVLVACGGDDAEQRTDDPAQAGEPGAEQPPAGGDTAAQPAPASEQPVAGAAQPDPAADPAPEGGKPAAGQPAAGQPEAGADGHAVTRSADGIDDEHPLPTDKNSAAFTAFKQATETARSNPAAASQQFAAAAGKTSYFYAAYFNAATAAEAAGDPASAERFYRETLKIRPDYGPALTNLYLLLQRSGRKADADRLVDDALKSHADRAGPHVAAAMRAYVQRKREVVKSEALRAIEIDERQVPAMRMMAWVFMDQKRYETAKFALENALALEPGNALLHLELGHVQKALDEEGKAMQSYGNAAKLRPDLAEAHDHYGVLLLKTGDADAAAAAFKEVVKLRPKSAEAQMHLANGLRAQKKYKEAEGAYQQALALKPGLHEVHYNLGVLYLDNEVEGMDYLERLEKSKAELNTYVEKASPDADFKSRIDDYLKTVKKRIKREKKKRKRDAERKAIEAEAKKEAAAEAEGAAAPEGEAGADGATGGEGEAGAEGAGNPDAAEGVDSEAGADAAGNDPAADGSAEEDK